VGPWVSKRQLASEQSDDLIADSLLETKEISRIFTISRKAIPMLHPWLSTLAPTLTAATLTCG
jgi:hypothetical protein